MFKTKVVNQYRNRARNHWIFITAIGMLCLNLYTFLPGYGQVSTPTPNIGTVPLFTLTPTSIPEDTPTPVATPVIEAPTVTPENRPADGGGNPNPPVETEASPNDSASISAQSEITLTAVVTVTTLNMRRAPGAQERLFDTLFLGDQVKVFAHNADGSWWLVCCGNRTQKSGWVNSAFLVPNFERSLALQLLPLATELSDALPDPLPVTATLQLSMVTSPTLVWQGQSLQLQIRIANIGDASLQNVKLRNHLPATLLYQQTIAAQNTVVQPQTAADGSTIINATWDEIAEGDQVTLTLLLTLDSSLPNGTLIDNIAVVSGKADGKATGEVTAGITIALPPDHLPIFR